MQIFSDHIGKHNSVEKNIEDIWCDGNVKFRFVQFVY